MGAAREATGQAGSTPCKTGLFQAAATRSLSSDYRLSVAFVAYFASISARIGRKTSIMPAAGEGHFRPSTKLAC
jgi:hypothetical protein